MYIYIGIITRSYVTLKSPRVHHLNPASPNPVSHFFRSHRIVDSIFVAQYLHSRFSTPGNTNHFDTGSEPGLAWGAYWAGFLIISRVMVASISLHQNP